MPLPSPTLPISAEHTETCGPAAHIPLVEVTRGGLVESLHLGAFAVVDETGDLLVDAGDSAAPFYPRSTLKPLQLTAMLRAGLDLPPELLALAAASHSGAPEHVAGARRILGLHGLEESDLGNAPDLPYGAAERERHLRAGGTRTRLVQNCSGKHAAMLATCMINGWSRADYLDPAHPLQRLIAATIAELTGESADVLTTDGCGTPLPSSSLRGIARAYAALAAAAPGTSAARAAAAMRAHPEMVGGPGRDVTALMRTVPGLIAKDGAEAVQLLGLRPPGGRALGIAVKIADGTDRARLPITRAILTALGTEAEALAEITSAPVLGGGRAVGELRAAREVWDRLGGLGFIHEDNRTGVGA
ncbi:MAG: asparaginase [Brevibacterium sp.]